MRIYGRAFLAAFIFTPSQVLSRGFKACHTLPDNGQLNDQNIDLFKTHYGADPITLLHVWCDIVTNPELSGMSNQDTSKKGFKSFLVAITSCGFTLKIVNCWPDHSVLVLDKWRETIFGDGFCPAVVNHPWNMLHIKG